MPSAGSESMTSRTDTIAVTAVKTGLIPSEQNLEE